jgi:hypothetical protein
MLMCCHFGQGIPYTSMLYHIHVFYTTIAITSHATEFKRETNDPGSLAQGFTHHLGITMTRSGKFICSIP